MEPRRLILNGYIVHQYAALHVVNEDLRWHEVARDSEGRGRRNVDAAFVNRDRFGITGERHRRKQDYRRV